MILNNRFLRVLERFRTEQESNSYLNSFSWGRDFNNYFAEFQRAKESDWPEVITYYCTSRVADSVIGNGRMWLNDVRKMNDDTEMTFAVDYIQQELFRIKNKTDSNLGLIEVIEESYKDLTDSAIWKDSLTYNSKLILAMCFTEAKDDAAMWDRYADSGKGVAIHFNLNKLSTAVKSAGHFFPNSLAFEHGVTRVCYGGKKCSCLDEVHNYALEAYADTKTSDEKDLIRTLLHANVLELLVSHKHESFVSEREYRIYSRAPSVKTWSGTDHIHEHEKGNKKSVHAEIFLPHQAINQSEDEFWNELIDGVTVGPCSNQETRDIMSSALEIRGIEDRLYDSTCPLVTFD